MSFYGFDNRYMLDMIALYKDVFVGTAVIDPHADAPERLDERAGEERRCGRFAFIRGLSKQPPAKWLEPAGYSKMFAAAAKNNQAMSCLIDPDACRNSIACAASFRNTPVIIDHLCRIGADGVIADKDVDALCAMAMHKKVLVKVGAFYALGKKTPPYTDLVPMIRKVVKAFGPKRCMWESDCPFQVVKQPYQASVDLVRKHLDFLTADDRDWMLRRTAEEFFFPRKNPG